MTDKFPLQLLQAISDWQRGGDAKQNKKARPEAEEVCVSLPEKYRTCSTGFRQIALPERRVEPHWRGSVAGENLILDAGS
jgi:hypothetical protein